MSKDLKLQLVSQPQDFFRELLDGAFDKRAFRPTAETSFYLVSLLNRFMTTDALYSKGQDGRLEEESLALLVKDAVEASEARERRAIYRQVGDLSLYRAGFFQESLNRKLVDVDYYIEMGGHAYRQAASSRAADESLSGVFEELARKFALFVDILADVSDRTMLKSERDLLRLYDTWMSTKSERAARLLLEAGIIPSKDGKKSVQ
jgi:hypothetical protein